MSSSHRADDLQGGVGLRTCDRTLDGKTLGVHLEEHAEGHEIQDVVESVTGHVKVQVVATRTTRMESLRER